MFDEMHNIPCYVYCEDLYRRNWGKNNWIYLSKLSIQEFVLDAFCAKFSFL